MTLQIEIENKVISKFSKFFKGFVFFKVWQYKLKLKPRDKTSKLYKKWYFAAHAYVKWLLFAIDISL